MPGQWYPFCSNIGSDEPTRKRRSLERGDLEMMEEHPVSPKRHCSNRNTLSPARKGGMTNAPSDPSLTAFGFSQLPFSTGPPSSAATSSGASMTFFGSYEQNGSAATAMETDDCVVLEQGLLSSVPNPKSLGKHQMAMNNNGEINRQRTMEENNRALFMCSSINMEPHLIDIPGQRERNGTIGCSAFRHYMY